VYAPTWANDQPQLSAFLKTALAAAGVGRLRDLIAHYEQSFALWQEPDGYSFKKDRRSMKAKRAIRREIKRSLAILEVLRRS
jgi:hypothetical protein